MKIKIATIILSGLLLGCSAQKQDQAHVESFPKLKLVYQDFETFYDRFISDSAFQMSRIKFPLKGQYQDYDNERKWLKENWPLMTWDLRSDKDTLGNEYEIRQDSLEFYWAIFCRDCGFSFEMQFEKLEGKWYLIYRQENNY